MSRLIRIYIVCKIFVLVCRDERVNMKQWWQHLDLFYLLKDDAHRLNFHDGVVKS